MGGKIWKENVFPLHFAIDPHGDCPAAVGAAWGEGAAQTQKFLGQSSSAITTRNKRHFKYYVESTYLCFPQLLNGGILVVLEELWGKLWGNSVLSSKQFVLR